MPKKYLFLFAAVGVLLGAAISMAVMPGGSWGRPHFTHEKMVLTRADGEQLSFNVEVAIGENEQSYGLMYLHTLPDDAGMIFPYSPAREVAFWMKNTYIPLDMLFIKSDHTVGRIVTNAQPLDVTPIPSVIDTVAVIELKGGIVAKDHIALGDKVEAPSIP